MQLARRVFDSAKSHLAINAAEKVIRQIVRKAIKGSNIQSRLGSLR
jgi:hypothetical protein